MSENNTSNETKPLIGIASMGGTIAMVRTPSGGLEAALDAAQMVSGIPELAGRVEVRGHAVSNVGSPSVAFSDVIAAYRWADMAVTEGASGVVITHGTDTLEETAFLLSLWWHHSEPLIVTGAMRSPEESGADGPANVLAAVTVAMAPHSRDRGVLVVMNDEVFAADRVVKRRTFGVDAFASPYGALGRFIEGDVEYDMTSNYPQLAPLPVPDGNAWVPAIDSWLGQEGRGLTALLEAGADGIVIEGVGAGHVPARMLDAVDAAIARIPVVMASRTRGGRTGRITYGYPGADIDLLRRGIVMAGRLTTPQARLLLWSLLSSGQTDVDVIRKQFTARGR